MCMSHILSSTSIWWLSSLVELHVIIELSWTITSRREGWNITYDSAWSLWHYIFFVSERMCMSHILSLTSVWWLSSLVEPLILFLTSIILSILKIRGVEVWSIWCHAQHVTVGIRYCDDLLIKVVIQRVDSSNYKNGWPMYMCWYSCNCMSLSL